MNVYNVTFKGYRRGYLLGIRASLFPCLFHL